ncbi:RNA polymerase sigma factor [Dokdonella sp.]|uniref:RNA polymerase sigma factor n=1 Tax=Dokdonella sp. TaxID=2291710 RepID=UPI003C63960C
MTVNSTFCIDVPASLVSRIQRGDVQAFEQIYRMFERPAWNLALRMLGDREDAREIVHDALLRVFERASQFRGTAPFWGWVRQIVLNEALMRLRRERGRPSHALEEGEELLADTAPPWATAESGLLEAALLQLPATTRSVIWLYHVEGHTHSEIAEMTGNSISFSKSQLARGTARLRQLLESPEAGESCSLSSLATA